MIDYQERSVGRCWRRKEFIRAIANLRTTLGDTMELHVTLGLYQGSALSLYLFTQVMDELTNTIQNEIPWCMLSTYDM